MRRENTDQCCYILLIFSKMEVIRPFSSMNIIHVKKPIIQSIIQPIIQSIIQSIIQPIIQLLDT